MTATTSPPAGVMGSPSVAERVAAGRAARSECPRSSHATWEPAPNRRDPVELLHEQCASRVPDLVPLRYGRMLASPFTFYRGAAYVMAADLASIPHTGLQTQLCGDAHLSNFGAYAAPDRRLVFDCNDFDETLPGPFEWDVKRLVASFAVAGRSRGFDRSDREDINRMVVRSYREAMGEYAELRELDVWYSRIDLDELFSRFAPLLSDKERERVQRNIDKTRHKDSMRAFEKMTKMVDGEARIVSDPPVIVPVYDLAGQDQRDDVTALAASMIRSYADTLVEDRQRLLRRFRPVDAARKVVGVGSVGTRAWILLLLGRDGEDPLFLQFKEAQPSVLEPFLGASEFSTGGQRVVEGQRLMQGASDIMLGWLRVTGFDGIARDYYVRQLWDAKGSADVDAMSVKVMRAYAELCGHTLARAHARGGDRIAIASYLGRSDSFDRAMASFAEAYADQNERDYKAMKAAVDDGRIEVLTGV
jgi:uncharacterized protein (DUF2252 family)